MTEAFPKSNTAPKEPMPAINYLRIPESTMSMLVENSDPSGQVTNPALVKELYDLATGNLPDGEKVTICDMLSVIDPSISDLPLSYAENIVQLQLAYSVENNFLYVHNVYYDTGNSPKELFEKGEFVISIEEARRVFNPFVRSKVGNYISFPENSVYMLTK